MAQGHMIDPSLLFGVRERHAAESGAKTALSNELEDGPTGESDAVKDEGAKVSVMRPVSVELSNDTTAGKRDTKRRSLELST